MSTGMRMTVRQPGIVRGGPKRILDVIERIPGANPNVRREACDGFRLGEGEFIRHRGPVIDGPGVEIPIAGAAAIHSGVGNRGNRGQRANQAEEDYCKNRFLHASFSVQDSGPEQPTARLSWA